MKGNKGEWSEIYTFLKLLGEGVIYGGDENTNKIASIFYPLIAIIREEERMYRYNTDDSNINIVDSNGNLKMSVSKKKFIEMSDQLLNLLKNSNKSSLEFPEIEQFLNKLHVTKIKSKASSKRDITLIVHDVNTNTEPTLGFSIKSQLGGSSTLLNAGESTNFYFSVQHNNGPDMADFIDYVNSIDTRSKIKDRTKFILKSGYLLKYNKIDSNNFKLNLQMIDTLLPEILSEMLIYYYSGLASTLKELVELLEKNNPLNFDQSANHRFYEMKLKNFLTDVALGMTPQKVWTGFYDATGGYIIVKQDGDLVCYHIYNRNEFQEYLLKNTYLDTPSSGRYHFGELFKENDEVCIKLNLQIRFL